MDSKGKRKDSFQENFGNPNLFNQFTPMPNILNQSNLPNLNNMSHLAGLNGLNSLSMQNMGVMSGFPNIGGGMGNPSLPNLANVPPQFNYYGAGPNFFSQNGFMQQPNEIEGNKSSGNYNFMQMNNNLNSSNQFSMPNKNTNPNEKNRMGGQNFNYFPTGFGMDQLNSQGEGKKKSEKGETQEENFERATSNQGIKENFEGQKQQKEYFFVLFIY